MAENKIQKSHLINMLTLIIHTSTFTIINQTNHTYSTKLIRSLKGRRKRKFQNHIQNQFQMLKIKDNFILVHYFTQKNPDFNRPLRPDITNRRI